MRKRQLIAALMAGVVTCGALAGCGGGDSSAQNQDGEQTTAASSGQGQSAGGNSESGSAPEGKQVLSVTTWDNESSPQFQAVIDAYEEKILM